MEKIEKNTLAGTGELKKPLRERVVMAVFWSSTIRLLSQSVTWVITIYVARILSPSDYGIMTMTATFTGFAMLFNEMGIGSAIIHKENVSKEDLSSIFWLLFLYNLTLFFCSLILAPVVAEFYNEPRLVSIIRLIGFNFIISSIGIIPYHMLTKDLSFGKRSLSELAGHLSGGLTTLLLAVAGYGVWSLVFGIMAVTVVTNLCYCALYPWSPLFAFSFTKIRDMANFGFKIAGARLLWYIYSNADSLIAGKMLGKLALGFYSMAFQFASVPMDKIVSILTQVAFPAFSEVKSDKLALKNYFFKIVKFTAFVTFPLFLGIFIVSEEAVNLLLTDKWMPLVLPLKILCIVSTIRAVNAINVPLVVASGRAGLAMITNLIFALIMPVAFYIGSFYGLEGFAYSWLFVFPFLFLVITYITLNAVGFSIKEYFWELRHPFLATLAMVVIITLIKETSFYSDFSAMSKVVTAVTAGSAIYLLYHAVIDKSMLFEALSLIKKLGRK